MEASIKVYRYLEFRQQCIPELIGRILIDAATTSRIYYLVQSLEIDYLVQSLETVIGNRWKKVVKA